MLAPLLECELTDAAVSLPLVNSLSLGLLPSKSTSEFSGATGNGPQCPVLPKQ